MAGVEERDALALGCSADEKGLGGDFSDWVGLDGFFMFDLL